MKKNNHLSFMHTHCKSCREMVQTKKQLGFSLRV